MRFLSLYGSDGFRTFRGILSGKNFYAPDKLPKLDGEILLERDFSIRLRTVLEAFTDHHPQLKNITPNISQQFGLLQSISRSYSLWQPKNHLSLLGQYLMASCFEHILSEEFEQDLYFTATSLDSGIAFVEAFSLEQKNILYPMYLDKATVPNDDKLTVYRYDNKDADARAELDKNQILNCEQKNYMRIVGHMVTIIEALYQTEVQKQRFYNDPVSLVLPADNMEFLLAGYYLTAFNFPIKQIYAVSSQHRMIHQFLETGEFVLSDINLFQEFEISLDRFLFEAARASAEKVVHWKQNLKQTGRFRVDSMTLERIKAIFTPKFAIKRQCESIQEDLLDSEAEFIKTRLSQQAYLLVKESSEHILAFDLENNDAEMQDLSQYPLF